MSFKDLIDGVSTSIGNAATGVGLSYGKGGLSISANFNERLQKKMTKGEQNSPLKVLYEELYGPPDIMFPLDLDAEHHIIFKQIKRVRAKENSDENTRTIKTIILPLPNNLSPQYSANYKDQEMGIAGALGAGTLSTGEVGSAIDNGMKAAGNGIDAFTKFISGGEVDKQTSQDIKQIGSAATTVGGAALLGSLAGGNIGGIIGAAVGGLGTGAQGVMSRFNKTFNSHLAVLFDGVGFRTFNFNYRFVPRNPKESEQLKEMIFAFKKAMYPSLPSDNKFMFTYPDEFMIEFCNAIKGNMFTFKRCVLKDIQVTYNGDGVPRFFDDGTPAVVDISMAFQEVEIVTKEDMISPEESA